MGGDYWFTYIYESQTAERIRAAAQERLAAENCSVYRQQQLAARRRRHQVKLTVSKPAELVEVASWASSPTEFIEWIGEELSWPPTDDPMARLLARHRSGECSAWSARVSDRLVGFGALNVRHGGQVAELSYLLVKRHRHAAAIAVELVRQLAALAFADPHGRIASADAGRTRCHSRDDRGVYSARPSAKSGGGLRTQRADIHYGKGG